MKENTERKITHGFRRFFNHQSHFRYLIMGAVGLLAVTLLLQLTWNFVIPALFGLTSITFWQALGMLVLLRLMAGVMGLSRRRWARTRPLFPGSVPTGMGHYDHTFMSCGNHRII